MASNNINALYQELFGRDAEPGGAAYWQTQLEPRGGTGNIMRQAMIESAGPEDRTYFNNRGMSENDWASYTGRAQQQMAGMNNMPGVFSNYGALASATPAQANAMLYHDQDSLKSILENFGKLYGIKEVEQLANVDPAQAEEDARNKGRAGYGGKS